MPTRRFRQHVNPLSLHHLDTRAAPLVLPPGTPVEVELGCADARFLFDRCRKAPHRSYVGIEIRRALVEQINARARREGLGQVRLVYANLHTDLEILFRTGQIDLCYLNFPDPFFKRSQRKRRSLTPALARVLTRLIHPGGLLFFQSDIFDLALEALQILEETQGLRNAAGPWSFQRENPFGVCSGRERRCTERGLRIWRLLFNREE